MHQLNAHILLVEDEDILATIIEDALSSQGYQVTIAEDGLAAWQLLEAGAMHFETILLDREMPRMDGISLLRKLKSSSVYKSIPVIMETAACDTHSVQEGLDAGAYYYLTKPFQPELLLSIVHSAVDQFREYQQLQENVRNAEQPFALLDQGVFHFRTLKEGRILANFFARACPDPEETVLGLQELLVNAVEHGNLAISYAEKSRLLKNDAWQDEIELRLAHPVWGLRQVEVVFVRDAQKICFTIRDQGEGFDWQKYLDFDPERAFDAHGRGIAMARHMSFDQLEYQGNGNTVVATLNINPPPSSN